MALVEKNATGSRWQLAQSHALERQNVTLSELKVVDSSKVTLSDGRT